MDHGQSNHVEVTIRSLQSKIDEIKGNQDKAFAAFEELTSKLHEGQLGLIAAMHYKHRLKTLLEAVNINQSINITKFNAYAEPFLSGLKQYNDVYRSLKSKYNLTLQYKFERPHHNFLNRKALLKKLIQVTSKKGQTFERAIEVNKFIDEELFPTTQYNEWDQCLLTWMRMHTENTLKQIWQADKITVNTLCCRLHFPIKQKIQNIQCINQSFEQSLQSHASLSNLKRNMVGFLNCVQGSTSSGGFHYYGISHSADLRKVYIEGVRYDVQIKQKVLDSVRQVIKQIEPFQNVDEDTTPAQENEQIKQFDKKVNELMQKSPKDVKQNYQICTLVEVDFIHLYNPETLLYAQKQGSYLVIPRVKVYTGDPYDVYFCVNEKDMPQPYYRKGKNQSKLTVQEFYDEMYRKLKKRADENIEDKYGELKFHSLCRFKGKK